MANGAEGLGRSEGKRPRETGVFRNVACGAGEGHKQERATTILRRPAADSVENLTWKHVAKMTVWGDPELDKGSISDSKHLKRYKMFERVTFNYKLICFCKLRFTKYYNKFQTCYSVY